MKAKLKGKIVFNFKENENQNEKFQLINKVIKSIDAFGKGYMEDDETDPVETMSTSKKEIIEIETFLDAEEEMSLADILSKKLSQSKETVDCLDALIFADFCMMEGKCKRIMRNTVIVISEDKGKIKADVLDEGEMYKYNRTNCVRFELEYFDEEMYEYEKIENYSLSCIFKRKLEGAETQFKNEAEWNVTGNVLRYLGTEISGKTSEKVLEIVRNIWENEKPSDIYSLENKTRDYIIKNKIKF
jgi:hypothetical protein